MTLERQTLLQSITIEPGQGAHGTIEKGQMLRIIDVQGQQVFDFSSFNRDDPTEYCDLVYSLFVKEAWKLAAEDKLYTQRMRPLWSITADTCGVHEWTGGFCSHAFNRFLGHDQPGCKEVLEAELSKLELSPQLLIPSSCLNPFMNMPHRSDGSWRVEPPVSQAGDYLELRAEMPIVWVGSVCTMPPPTNGWPLSSIRCEVYSAESRSQ